MDYNCQAPKYYPDVWYHSIHASYKKMQIYKLHFVRQQNAFYLLFLETHVL
jgi:hypothetical protein